MKNYYEILEVSESASSEVIEKAYKALVKKYHPDLQPNEKKQEAENKIKMINEAYNILSNVQKKESYDRQLKLQKKVVTQPQKSKSQKDEVYHSQTEYNQAIREAYNNAYRNAYYRAYINNLKNMGYRIKYKKSFKEKVKTFFATILAIIVFIVICFILWQIPFIKNYFIDLYNSNNIFKILVDLINNIFKSFFALFINK